MNNKAYSPTEIAALLAETCLHAGVIEVDGAIHDNRPDWAREAVEIFDLYGWIERSQEGTNGSAEEVLRFDMARWRSVLLPLKERHGHPLDRASNGALPR